MKNKSNSKVLGTPKSFRIQSYYNLQCLSSFKCGSRFLMASLDVIENNVIDYLRRNYVWSVWSTNKSKKEMDEKEF